MPYLYQSGVLIVLADPRFYPHIHRHLHTLLKRCVQVNILAVFPTDVEKPSEERVVYHR